MDSSIWQWKMNSEFQSLVGFRIARTIFRIPKTRMLDSMSKFCRTPDSTSKKFLVSGILDYRTWGEVTVILALYGIKKITVSYLTVPLPVVMILTSGGSVG